MILMILLRCLAELIETCFGVSKHHKKPDIKTYQNGSTHTPRDSATYNRPTEDNQTNCGVVLTPTM